MEELTSEVEQSKKSPIIQMAGVLEKSAGWIDKISETELPLTYGQAWTVVSLLSAGLVVQQWEAMRQYPDIQLPPLSGVFGKGGDPMAVIVGKDGLLGYVRDVLRNNPDKTSFSPEARNFFLDQFSIIDNMIGILDERTRMLLGGITAMGVLGNISEYASKPVKMSDRIGKVPGVGRVFSKSLRSIAGLLRSQF